MTVRQLLNSIDSRELTEWRAFFIVDSEIRQQSQEAPLEQNIKGNMTGYKR